MFKDRELDQEERSVRGILVTGLTESDIAALDIFEGNVRYFLFYHKLSKILIFLHRNTYAKKLAYIPLAL